MKNTNSKEQWQGQIVGEEHQQWRDGEMHWFEYKHSSASFYELQQVVHFSPVHYKDLE